MLVRSFHSHEWVNSPKILIPLLQQPTKRKIAIKQIGYLLLYSIELICIICGVHIQTIGTST
jgi:hypothetical protein